MPRDPSAYESYQGFLKAAIKAYWHSEGRSKVNFLALLLASREAWEVAWEGATAPGSGKKILAGAAGAAALGVLLRVVLGGPVGLILTGASVASLVALYVRNHERIWKKVAVYKKLIEEQRGHYNEIRGDFLEGNLREGQRDLMIDGLMSRFLAKLDEEPEEPTAAADADGEEADADGDARDAEDDA